MMQHRRTSLAGVPPSQDFPMTEVPAVVSFRDLDLAEPLLKALEEVGYETPSPIQAQAIPHLLNGLDILGHAPTGTGKTAAFALPLLSRIDPASAKVQVMTLCPTRELAIQVAEAYQRYAVHMKNFHVLPIYGGQEYSGQIRQLKRGVQVVVGTPGRVMDHMRKGTLKLDGLQALVLDEADEMLRMGFVDEVEWILDQTPDNRQMALFSATMPKEVERIARRHLNNPEEVAIEAKTATAETIRQRFWPVKGFHKLDALTRILEVEPFDAVIIFVRTKNATVELAEKLEARGYAAAAMNGDMVQKDRERMVDRLKKSSLDILIATDVAARGLDVERISHVINYDIPYDAEAYIHRIGRTGRAGRKGDAILFVAPRERRMLGLIEKATRQPIEQLEMPTTETVNNKRIADFKQRITDTLASDELAFMRGLVEQYRQEHDVPSLNIAAALAQMSLGDKELLIKKDERPLRPTDFSRDDRKGRSKSRKDRGERRGDFERGPKREINRDLDPDKERFRIEVGNNHGVKPGNIVGAIANEAGLDGKNIGSIEINDDHSIVDLPKGMPKEIFKDLSKARVCGQALSITRLGKGAPKGKFGGGAKSAPKGKGRSADGKKAAPKGKKRAGDKKSGNDFGKKSGGKPANKSAGKPSGKSADKPAGKPKSKAAKKTGKKRLNLKAGQKRARAKGGPGA